MINPYTLPDGNVQISFSGGRTSGYMLHAIMEAYGGLPERARVVFANTGREMPETLDFVHECGERWGVKIWWVEDSPARTGPLFNVVSHNSASRAGEPFAALIRRKKACPDQSKRFCTEQLKMLPARRFLMAHGWRAWTNAVGIRADEQWRLNPSTDKRVERWFPLADAGVTKSDVLSFWDAQPFDLRIEPGYGNCDGCFLKSEAQLAALARDYPERHAWWERVEAVASVLTASPGGARFRNEYTRRELRERVEAQGDLLFDLPGLLCQADAGECTG